MSGWFSRVGLILVLLAACVLAASAAARPALPNFDGWQKAKSSVADKPGWGLTANDAEVMRELGLSWIERDTYQFNGRAIQVQGYRFGDPGGAYGAFTYFRPDNFHAFDIGQPRDQAASGNTSILFTRGDWLIRVQMDQLTAMTASQMRQLAQNLTATAGADQLPSLPFYLPRKGLQANSLHFVRGPVGFAAACQWVPTAGLGFDQDAQAVVASYDFGPDLNGAESTAQLVILSYPTPQMARTHFAELQQQGLQARRSGPLVAVVRATPAAAPQAAALLTQINWDAEITLVPPTPLGLTGLPALILGIFVLCALIMGVAILVGLLSGALWNWVDRFLPERFRRSARPALIRLGLGSPAPDKFSPPGHIPS